MKPFIVMCGRDRRPLAEVSVKSIAQSGCPILFYIDPLCKTYEASDVYRWGAHRVFKLDIGDDVTPKRRVAAMRFEGLLRAATGYRRTVEYVVAMDSDILPHPDLWGWLDKHHLLHPVLTGGILNYYDRPGFVRRSLPDGSTLRTVGIGGCLAFRNSAEFRTILTGGLPTNRDWSWDTYLSMALGPVYTPPVSYVRHLGMNSGMAAKPDMQFINHA